MIDVASMDDQLTFSGWALSRTPASAVFLVDGIEVDSVAYPLPSPDVAAAFPDLSEAEICRFHCTHGGRVPPGHIAELVRIAAPGGHVLLTIQGPAVRALAGLHQDVVVMQRE